MGLHLVAAASSAIRQAACLLAFPCCKHHHHGHRAAVHSGFDLPDKPYPSWLVWLTRGITLRDLDHGYCMTALQYTFLGSSSPLTLKWQWFTHERPKYMAWYGWSLALTGKLAPMISGFINSGMGWEWTLVSVASNFGCMW